MSSKAMPVENGSWDEACARQETVCGAIRPDRDESVRLAALLSAARQAGLDPVQFSLFVNRLYKQQYSRRWAEVASQVVRPREWTAVSDLLCHSEFADFVRLVGPRWNTFSLLGQLGPISAQRELVIDGEPLLASSDAWTTTVLDEKYRPVAVVGSQSDVLRQRVTLAPGKYLVTHRFYTDEDALRCPAVEIDGTPAIEGMVVPQEKSKYAAKIEEIANARSPLFFWQQFYVFHYLRHAPLFDADTVRREFLPVGDPNNVFDYGPMSALAALSLSASESTLRDYRIYLAYFNEMSAPVFGTQVTRAEWRAGRAEEDGAYLLRFVPRRRMRLAPRIPEYRTEMANAGRAAVTWTSRIPGGF